MQQRCSSIEQATQFQQLVVVMSRTDASADGPRPRRPRRRPRTRTRLYKNNKLEKMIRRRRMRPGMSQNNSGGPATGRYRKKMEGLLSFS